eukprot:5858975-Amphidinium_carterae.1
MLHAEEHNKHTTHTTKRQRDTPNKGYISPADIQNIHKFHHLAGRFCGVLVCKPTVLKAALASRLWASLSSSLFGSRTASRAVIDPWVSLSARLPQTSDAARSPHPLLPQSPELGKKKST